MRCSERVQCSSPTQGYPQARGPCANSRRRRVGQSACSHPNSCERHRHPCPGQSTVRTTPSPALGIQEDHPAYPQPVISEVASPHTVRVCPDVSAPRVPHVHRGYPPFSGSESFVGDAMARMGRLFRPIGQCVHPPIGSYMAGEAPAAPIKTFAQLALHTVFIRSRLVKWCKLVPRFSPWLVPEISLGRSHPVSHRLRADSGGAAAWEPH